MAKKRGGKPEDQKNQEPKSVSRRNFLTHGAVAGVSAAALGGSVGETSAQATGADGIKWDYEADVVVIGSGASGMPCAIRARDAGLRVLVVDQNFDVGGKMLHSGGQISLGGGDPCQLRDIAGRSRQGRVHQGRPAAQAAGHDRRIPISCSGTSPTGRSSMSAATPRTATTNARCIVPGPTTATAPGNS